MKILLGPVAAALVVTGCTNNAAFEILGKEVFDGAFIVCKTKVEWDGVSVLVEGIEADKQDTTDKYTIGKLEYKETSIRQLDSIALAVDAIFEQMCSSTVALRNDKDALKAYIPRRDETALMLVDMLSRMEAINEDDSLSEKESVSKQNEVAKPAIKEAMENVKT